MKNFKLTALIILVAAVVSCNNQQQAGETELAVPVSIENVTLHNIQQFINTTGTARANQEVELNTEIAGDYHLQNNPATGRKFKLGDRVQKGQVIVRLEDVEYVNNIALDAKKLNLEISQDEYEKQKSLYEKGGVTLYELRNSEVSKTNAAYDFESAQISLAKMNVTAPFSGVITELPYFTEDTRVAANSHVASLMNYDKMYMDINLPEKNISEVEVGQQVLVTNYTISEDTLSGKVTELSPAISTETRTFSGVIEIDNPQRKLRPGMFVKADIVTASKDSTIVIPKDVILSGNRGKYVFVVERNNAADDRRITTGIENQDYVEVVEGLKKNDRLIVKGFETLRDDSKVKVIR
ncbi:MAG TPA: efflux RND transporter periplasmic adaptor subunit [Prolixibacteraceae bacterium]|nr:efflux RND transporter periplasmic adaptor subunit [Prolixibacteraceae bacterium]